jgi:hypothetical protein
MTLNLLRKNPSSSSPVLSLQIYTFRLRILIRAGGGEGSSKFYRMQNCTPGFDCQIYLRVEL